MAHMNHGVEPTTEYTAPQVPTEKSAATPQPPPYNEQPRDPYPAANPYDEQPRDPYPVQQPMSNAGPPVTPLQQLGEVEAWIDCPFCHRRTRTRVDKADSSMTFVIGLLLCLICICAACIPCIAHWCADIDHYCSECNKRVTHRPYNGQIQVMCEQNGLPYSVPSRYAQAPNLEAGGAGHEMNGAAKPSRGQ